MAWTAFPTWVAGQVSLASDWNNFVAANMQFLATPPMWRAYLNGAYTLTAGAFTLFPYDTVTIDTVDGFNTTSSEYVVQVAGTYAVAGSFISSSSAAAHSYIFSLYYNGNESQRGFCGGGDPTSPIDNGAYLPEALIGPCVVGDQLQMYYYATSADALQVGQSYLNWFNGCKISN
jgi:hypothetical protein